MSSEIFSDYVRALVPGEEPADTALDALWDALRRRLRRALERRGLWRLPPRFVGVFGEDVWTSAASAGRRGVPARGGDALDELAADFYCEVFARKLPILRRYVARGDAVEAVVARMVGQFLHDRQRRHDPLGHTLYRWLRAALRRAVDRGRLRVSSGDERIDNRTVLVFAGDRSAGGETAAAAVAADVVAADVVAVDDASPAGAGDFTTAVRGWVDELLPPWLGGGGRLTELLVAGLERRVVELASAGVAGFVFKELVDVWKDEVRARLADLGPEPEEASAPHPLRRLLADEGLRGLERCVEEGLERTKLQRRTRDKLERLWRFLGLWARADEPGPDGDPEPDAGGVAGGALTKALARPGLPSNRELSRVLDIRHDRFPALYARLRVEVERCLELLRERRGVDTLGASARSHGPEGSLDQSRDLRRELRRVTAEALRREDDATPAVDGPRPEPAAAPPRPGELYHLPASPEPGLEWLVLERADDGWLLLVPADGHDALGSVDVAVTDETAAGALVVRCDLGVWLASEALGTIGVDAAGSEASPASSTTGLDDGGGSEKSRSSAGGFPSAAGARGVGVIAAADLERARACRRRWLAGDVAGDDARETDLDSDYRDWREALELARGTVATAHRGRPDEPPAATGQPASPADAPTSTPDDVAPVVPLDRPLPGPASVADAARAVDAARAAAARAPVASRRRRSAAPLALAASVAAVLAGAFVAGRMVERSLDAGAPELGVPWRLAPPGIQRGFDEVESLLVTPATRTLALLIDAEAGDRVELRDAGDDTVWSSTVVAIAGEDETLILWPAALTPAGGYRVVLWRGEERVNEFPLRIENAEEP